MKKKSTLKFKDNLTKPTLALFKEPKMEEGSRSKNLKILNS